MNLQRNKKNFRAVFMARNESVVGALGNVATSSHVTVHYSHVVLVLFRELSMGSRITY